MQRSLMIFYTANSSLAGLVACMLYPAFWQVLVVVIMSAALTFNAIDPKSRKKYLACLAGLGVAAALVAAVFGSHGNSLSPVGSVIGLLLGFTAIGMAVHFYRLESAVSPHVDGDSSEGGPRAD